MTDVLQKPAARTAGRLRPAAARARGVTGRCAGPGRGGRAGGPGGGRPKRQPARFQQPDSSSQIPAARFQQPDPAARSPAAVPGTWRRNRPPPPWPEGTPPDPTPPGVWSGGMVRDHMVSGGGAVERRPSGPHPPPAPTQPPRCRPRGAGAWARPRAGPRPIDIPRGGAGALVAWAEVLCHPSRAGWAIESSGAPRQSTARGQQSNGPRGPGPRAAVNQIESNGAPDSQRPVDPFNHIKGFNSPPPPFFCGGGGRLNQMGPPAVSGPRTAGPRPFTRPVELN